MPHLLQSMRRDDFVTMSVLFASYVITAVIGGTLFHAPAVLFPAAAVALAGLVIGGIRLWPAITLASLVASFYQNVPLPFAIMLAVAHTVQAVTGARILFLLGFDPVFRRVRDMFTFMGTAFVTAAIVPSAVYTYVTVMNLWGSSISLPVTWFSWWAGLFLADLILASTLIRWMAKREFVRTRSEWVELAAAGTAVLGATYFLFWTDTSWMGGGTAILVYLMPFIWIVMRCGIRFTLTAFALTTIVGLAGLLYGWQPEGIETGRRLLTGEIFIAAIAVIFFLFVSVVEERKRATRELRSQITRIGSLLEESKRADRAKSEFIAVFAHELRNPLAPIVSAIELLKLKWGVNPDLAEIVNMIEGRTKTIVRLLDDLLDISRINEGKLRLQKELVDVGQIVRRAESALATHIVERHQMVRMSLPSEQLLLDADPVRIEQIIANLLSNASKFTPDGGHIEIAARPHGDTVIISVKDDGIGIESDMLSRIFEPFLQIEAGHRVNQGLGIGLSLTQKLVEIHGGTIVALSAGKGKGAEFRITLPRAKHAPEPISKSYSTRMQQSSLRILVVDDNEAAANGLGTLLTHVGNTVDFAYVGADVAGKVREFEPDVIVLDIGLPDISGYDVAEQLRTGGFGGRIIALTGYGQDEDKKKAEAAGFDHHLTKPVGLADLQAVLLKPV